MKRFLCLCAALVCLTLLSPARAEYSMLCLNVGKADCIILTVGDRHYLVDAGYDYTFGRLSSALSALSIDKLDGVFLTHVHKDHYGGLDALAQSDIAVDNWYASALFYDVKPQKHPLSLAAARRNQAPVWLEAGDAIDAGDASLTVLAPVSLNTDNENNNSLVLLLTTPEGNILLAADMKLEEENTLLPLGTVPACAALKVAHHGDNKATSEALLRSARPQIAVISTSTAQEPDTPAGETLYRLRKAGANVYVTQDYGDGILVTLSGGSAKAESVTFNLPPVAKLKLSCDPQTDLISVENAGSDSVALDGMTLYSTRGGDCYKLSGELAAGEQKSFGSDERADVILSDKHVLHKSKPDTVILYDQYGRELSRTDNGLSE